MSHGRFNNPIQAALAGFKDIFRKQELASRMTDKDQLDGKVCLVTGANRGLGYAIASGLATRGGEVLMACRSQIPEAGEQLKKATGSKTISMLPLDLADLTSIYAFCEDLKARKVVLEVVVLNAGIALPGARKTPQGQDTMFMVNYLSNFILLQRLLEDGTIPNNTYSNNGRSADQLPRILFISSDSHQNASAIDFEEFGTYFEYGVKKAINNYSYFKLLMNTHATELSRRLVRENGPEAGRPDVSVNVMCPGPVNTDIARAAPFVLRMTLRLIFTIIFQPPKKAAKPCVYMCVHSDFDGTTNKYLHMFNPKRMDEKVYDPKEGQRIWEASMRVWKEMESLLDSTQI